VTHYGDLQDSNWTNAEFHADLAEQNEQLDYMVQSWIEQRNYGVNFPLEALKAKGHPLAEKIEAEFARMEPKVPVDPEPGMKRLPLTAAGSVLKGLGGWADVSFDVKTGAITQLSKSKSATTTTQAHAGDDDGAGGGSESASASIAGPENPLLLVRYQALVESDFDAWRKEYILPGAGGFNEYGTFVPSSAASHSHLHYATLHYAMLHCTTLRYYCASKTEPRSRGRQDTSKPKIDT
jgi:hypothetical protein